VRGHQDIIHFYFASKDSYDTSEMITLIYTVCGLETIILNDPARAVFLLSRDGTLDYEKRTDHLDWFTVEWDGMDKSTYLKSEECGIDHYNLIEDSQNAPVLVAEGKECVNSWRFGKSIYPSLELCADAVLANGTNW
jgi:hypothetical protein